MFPGRIVILSGSPGVGKSAAAALLAGESPLSRSVHMHTDDFYGFLRKGASAPHLPQAHEQNRIVTQSFLAAASCFARGGYDVIVDGVLGPWFLEPWVELARSGCEVHYLVLRAGLEETLRRARSRDKLSPQENEAIVRAMWGQFADLGAYERHALETGGLTLRQSVSLAAQRIADRSALLL